METKQNVLGIKFESRIVPSAISGKRVRSTKATIKFENGNICGFSTQNVKDLDVKVIGQKAAINDALSTTKITKELRTEVWEAFRNRSKASNKILA